MKSIFKPWILISPTDWLGRIGALVIVTLISGYLAAGGSLKSWGDSTPGESYSQVVVEANGVIKLGSKGEVVVLDGVSKFPARCGAGFSEGVRTFISAQKGKISATRTGVDKANHAQVIIRGKDGSRLDTYLITRGIAKLSDNSSVNDSLTKAEMEAKTSSKGNWKNCT